MLQDFESSQPYSGIAPRTRPSGPLEAVKREVEAVRGRLWQSFEQLGQIGILTRDFLRALTRRPFELRLLIDQLDAVGFKSLTVVNLTAIFSGMVLALQMGQFLAKFGAKIYVSRIMGISLVRELGPVLTALMLGARVGAGITAELGTMKVTDQIEAMRALGTNPVKKLVVPRVLATTLMMPVLTMVADVVGLLGGWFISVTQLGVSGHYFYTSLMRNLVVGDVTSGLGKSIFFGFLVGIVACHKGLTASGGADGVGRATTSAVVAASISILISDFFLTKLFLEL
jgi:phospholipid/cholesterol/gamma-HCH transport system permease protein